MVISIVELRVQVVHILIPAPNRLLNHSLNPFRLKPRLTTGEVIHLLVKTARNVIVSTHEWIILAELVELDEEIIRRLAVEAGDITAGEDDTCHSECEDHVD